MKFDLHMHSAASSDGQFTPEELVDLVDDHNLNLIALSDHDTAQNVPAIKEIATKRGIQVINAIEVSTTYKGEHNVHLLGYGINPDDPWIQDLLAKAKENTRLSFGLRVKKINEKYGFNFDEDTIREQAGDMNPWFTMFDQIIADPRTKDIPDFQDYLPGGPRSQPAPVNFFWDKMQAGSDLYCPVQYPDLFEAIDHIHQAGGIAVIAHPFRTFEHQDGWLEELAAYGLDGLEAYSNYHFPEQIEYYRNFAAKHGLLITCGSDFHGKTKPNITLGEYHLDRDGKPILNAFLAALQNTWQGQHESLPDCIA